jgi:hypothetical protein
MKHPMISQGEHWHRLAERLDILVIAPFSINLNGNAGAFTAMLPQFGGAAGMVVDPEWSAIEPFEVALIEAGYGFSCVALDEDCADASAKEMLSDWSWNGTGEKPLWL